MGGIAVHVVGELSHLASLRYVMSLQHCSGTYLVGVSVSQGTGIRGEE